MRLLVVAEGEERRALLAGLASAAGHDVTAVGPARVLAAVSALPPDALVVDGVEDPEQARRGIERARAGLGATASVFVVVAHGSPWLRVLPGDTTPVIALVESDLGAKLEAPAAEATAHVTPGWARAGSPQRDALTWRPESREVVGPAGAVALTASESAILDLLLHRAGVVVPAAAVSRALWGETILDGHGRAAIRTHIYTLRRKLRAVGLAEVLVSAPGWGYRLEANAKRAEPTRVG